jgi:hypothetical protein
MAKRDHSRIADWADTLGLRLMDKFEGAERDRQQVEQRWVKALRMYRGKYSDDTLKAIDKMRSRTFIRSGRVKVEGLTRLELSIMLGNNDTSWTIEPTPNPDVSDQDWQGLVERVMEAKPDAGPEDFEAAVRALANIRARNMSREIQDQLDGNEDRRWSDIMRQAVFSKNLYGTGVVKGPLVEEYEQTTWKQVQSYDEQTMQPTMRWTPIREKRLRPYVEHVPLWGLYPDSSAKSIEDATFIFERHIKTKPELRKLGQREDFDSEKINKYISEYPEGSADQWKSYETDLNSLSDDRGASAKRERQYEVLEFWGLVPAKDLQDCGCEDMAEMDDDALEEDVWAHIWMLGPVVIKSAIQPLEGVTLPYKFGYFDKDESSIWGYGLMDLTEDTQDGINASVRILLDNAAICAGPQVEVNLDLLDAGEDIQSIYPFKIWARGGNGMMADANSPAVRVTPIPSMSQDIAGILQIMERFNDEVSGVPSSDVGDIGRIGKDQTATEASIRTQRSNAMVREQLLRWDDKVTRPTIDAIYRWNMQFNPREDIKGDYQIKARGVAGTQAKEIRAQQLVAFWQMVMGDPEARSMVKVDEVLRTVAQNMEIPDSVVRDKEDHEAWQQQQMEQQAMMQGQVVMQQLAPVLQQHEQAIQQISQAVQKVMEQMQGMSADGSPEIALKAKALEGELTLKRDRAAEELALKREEMAATADLKRQELAATLELKKMDHMQKVEQTGKDFEWKRGMEQRAAEKPAEKEEREEKHQPQPAPVVNVHIAPPAAKKRIKLERGPDGKVTGGQIEEEETAEEATEE